MAQDTRYRAKVELRKDQKDGKPPIVLASGKQIPPDVLTEDEIRDALKYGEIEAIPEQEAAAEQFASMDAATARSLLRQITSRDMDSPQPGGHQL